MSKPKPAIAKQRKTAPRKRRPKWSLLGDATANLKAWRKKLTLEDVIEMCNEPLEFEVKMRDPAELPKRRAG